MLSSEEKMKTSTRKIKVLNTIFVLKRWQKSEGNKKLVSAVIGILLKVINSLLGVALASIVISIVMSPTATSTTFLKIMAVVSAYAIGITLENYFYTDTRLSLFLYRIMELPNMFFKLLRLPFDQVEGPSGKEAFEKARQAVGVGNDIGAEAMVKNIIHLITYCLCLLGYIIISATLSPWIILVLLGTACLRTYRDQKNRKWYMDTLDQRMKTFYELSYLRRKCLDTGIGKDARIYRMEEWFEKKFDIVFQAMMKFQKKESFMDFMAELVDFLSGFGRDLVCYGYLIYRVSQGMPMDAFVLYLSVIAGFNVWIKNIFDEYAKYCKNVLIVNDYRLYLDKTEVDQGSYPLDIPEAKTYSIKFEDVCFKYQDGKNAIDHLNLDIGMGEKVALVGANGAGKTTLVKLMCGLYKPCSGKIYINGIDISRVNPKTLLDKIGVVFQQTKIFPDTIAKNVSCQTDANIDTLRVKHSLKEADLYTYVAGLALKEDTILTKNMDLSGVEMSGGQYQKLMLARAIYKAAPVLVLDEPTAALDPLAEEEMYKRYNLITAHKTSLFISHRLSSTQFCDRVIFLEGGSIKQDGTHNMLMKEEGPYKRMFDAQAHYYQEEVV